MSTEQIWVFIGIPFLLFLTYYGSPFIMNIWVKYNSRQKGRKIGKVHHNKISFYFQEELKKTVDNGNSITFDKLAFDSINKKIKEAIAVEYKRLESRYDPLIQEFQIKIDKVEKLEDKRVQNRLLPNLPIRISEKGKNVLEKTAFDSAYWRVTCLVYVVFLLLIFDTIISSEWISQIGMFSKSKHLFSEEIVTNTPLLKQLNFSYNTLLGFIMNITLLILVHLIFDEIEVP